MEVPDVEMDSIVDFVVAVSDTEDE